MPRQRPQSPPFVLLSTTFARGLHTPAPLRAEKPVPFRSVPHKILTKLRHHLFGEQLHLPTGTIHIPGTSVKIQRDMLNAELVAQLR